MGASPNHSEGVIAIIVNYNGSALTKRCIDSLESSTCTPSSIIVVDNGSDDTDREALKSLQARATLVFNERNTGYSGGINVGLRRAAGMNHGYVLILSQDVVLESSALQVLVSAMASNPRTAIAGPMVVWGNQPNTIWTVGSMARRLPLDVRFGWGDGQPRQAWEHKEPFETDYLAGCALLLRREAVEKVGEWEERYFLMEEDIDYAIRTRRAGFVLVAVPSAVVQHWVSSSVGRRSIAQRYFGTRSRMIFLRKHFSFLDILLQVAYLPVRIAADLAVTRTPRAVMTNLLGALDGLTDGFRDEFIPRSGARPPDSEPG